MIFSFGRVTRFAWQDFFRNWWLSLITITVIFVTLFSINLLLVWTVATGKLLASIQEKVDVSLYMSPSVKEIDVNEVRKYIETFPEVKTVVYVSRDETLAQFKERHAGDGVILESLEELEENPLGAELVITARSVHSYPRIIEKIASSPYQGLILDKSFGDHARVIERISAMSTSTRKVGLVSSIIFAFIAFLLVFNTIRVTIYTHREEIGIMKRVGASDWFARSPFLLESVVFGAIGFILSTALFFLFLQFIQPSFSAFFVDYAFDLTTYFTENAVVIFGIQLISVVLLTMLSALFAVRRYLKV